MPSEYYNFSCNRILDLAAIFTYERTQEQTNSFETTVREFSSPWKLVFGHKSIWSNGDHSNPPYEDNYNDPLADDILEPMKNIVDFYVSGNDHNKQLLEKKFGISQIVCGAGGRLGPVDEIQADNVFVKSSYDFCYILFTTSEARVSFVDKDENVEFSTTFNK
tara:strand:+ start:105 stop:593 length:489 start_codon:yes stop_codon:yes gene_type:complete